MWSGDGARQRAELAVQADAGLPGPMQAGEHDLYPVPELRVEVEAGTGAVAYDDDEHTYTNTEWLSATFIRREYGVPPDRVRTLTVRGDSMIDTISPGERVRVALWEGDRMWQRRIYVFNGPFGLTIKRWNSTADRIVLEADNPAVENRSISRDTWEADWSVVAWLLEVVKPL